MFINENLKDDYAKNRSKKIHPKILFTFFLSSLSLFSCTDNNPEITLSTSISDSSSVLLDVVTCDETKIDPVDNWVWLDKSIMQGNDDTSEFALCILYGYDKVNGGQYQGSLRPRSARVLFNYMCSPLGEGL